MKYIEHKNLKNRYSFLTDNQLSCLFHNILLRQLYFVGLYYVSDETETQKTQ